MIEDDPEDAQILRDVLNEAQPGRFHLNHVDRIQDGLERLAEGGVGLVLLDLNLPDSRGLESLRSVASRSPSVPIVVLTGVDDEASALRAVHEGGQDYLVKGRLNGDLLARALRLAVERKSTVAQAQHDRDALVWRLAERSDELARMRSALDAASLHPAPIPPWSAEARIGGEANGIDRGLARAMIEAIREPLVVLDGELRICRANRAFYRSLGCTHGEVEGRPLYEVGDRQWDSPDLRHLLEEIIPRDSHFDDFQLEQEFPGLGRRIMLLNARRIDAESGRPALVLLAIEDVTERRAAERALAAAARELRRSNRELEEFASIAAHDLQEPLRKIRAFATRLADGYPGVLDDRGRDYLVRITSAAVRMETLIGGLLDFARISTTRRPFTPVDLGDIASAVVHDLESGVERVGGRVEVGPLPTVEADSIQMRQLFQNLVANALKFRRPDIAPVVVIRSVEAEGGGVVSAHSASRKPAACRLEFEDNGIGFEERYAARIFAPFERLHGRSQYEGTGIGLALCRRIVERHGGIIAARSTPGQGSTFVVDLPIRPVTVEA